MKRAMMKGTKAYVLGGALCIVAYLGPLVQTIAEGAMASVGGSQLEYAAGQINVKLEPGAAQKLREARLEGKELKDISISPSFDELARRHGVTDVRMLFAGFERRDPSGRIETIETMREHVARIQRSVRARRSLPVDWSRVPDLTRWYIIDMGEGADVLAAVSDYKRDPAVESAEPNYKGESARWDQWHLDRINWSVTWTGEGVVVAVVDTGYDYEDSGGLASVWLNEAEVRAVDPNFPDRNLNGRSDMGDLDTDGNGRISDAEVAAYCNGQDDDGNGHIDDLLGWYFTYLGAGNNNVRDVPGDEHGTPVASLVARQDSDNNFGVARRALAIVVKHDLDAQGRPLSATCAAGIGYAVDNGARVINCSWGFGPNPDSVADAVKYAHALNRVVVAAAGNDGSFVKYPARMEECLAVGATRRAVPEQRYASAFWESNYGPGLDIDVMAPGEQIAAACYEGGTFAGTSAAAPQVSGLAALVIGTEGQYPFAVRNVMEQIRKTAEDIITDPDAPGEVPDVDIYSGYGRIDATRAVQNQGRISVPGDWGILYRNVGSADIIGTARGNGSPGDEYFLDYLNVAACESGPGGEQWQQIAHGDLVYGDPVLDGVLGTFNYSALPDGIYVVRLRVITGIAPYNEMRDEVRVEVLEALGENEVVFVDDGSTGYQNGSRDFPYSQIEYAMQAAYGAGLRVVKVLPGTYWPSEAWPPSDRFSVLQGIRLNGSTWLYKDEALYDPEGQSILKGGVDCDKPDISLRYLTVDGAGLSQSYGVAAYYECPLGPPYASAMNLRVYGNVIRGFSYYGAYLQGNGYSPASIQDSFANFRPLIEHNLITENGYCGLYARYTYPTIRSNRITNNPYADLYLGTAKAWIQHNYIGGEGAASGWKGIYASWCPELHIQFNKVLYHFGDGVYCTGYYNPHDPSTWCYWYVDYNLFGYNQGWDIYLTGWAGYSILWNQTLTPPLKRQPAY